MNISKTITIDMYKGFEGESGFFFNIKDKNGLTICYLKTWCGYIENIIYENPHIESDGWHGLTKLFHEDTLNSIDYSLENFYLIQEKGDFLNDLLWYKNNRYEKYDDETKRLLNTLIDISENAIKNDYDILVAYDED